jgi:glycosyltransferase involved in cell wall biosynthesis
MRILFLTHYFTPEVNAPASRTFEHAREWVRAGHDVTVLTCAPNHPGGKLYPGYRNRLFQRETIDGINVVRVWTFLAANEGHVRRIANYLSYMIGASLALPRLPRAVVVISTSPQFFCGLTGLIARAVHRAPWILEIRDIWPESIVTVGAMRQGLVTRGLEWLERLAYKQADRIVAVTDSFVSHIVERCGDAAKIAVIKNAVDLSLFNHSVEASVAKRALGLEGKFVAAYVGTHGMAHGLDTILDAARLMAGEPHIHFLMVGDGAERARLVERAKSMRLVNVSIVGQRPKADMPFVWAATDASLILLKRQEMFKKVLPSKMFEAMAMGCPIILGVEGEAKELLDVAGAGIGITPESADELAACLRKLASDNALCSRYGEQGTVYVRQNFDRAKQAARYLDLIVATADAANNVRGAVATGHDQGTQL